MKSKGFFGALFDSSFGTFVTPKLIRLLYFLVVTAVELGILLWGLSGLVAFLRDRSLASLGVLVSAPIAAVLGLIFVRIWMETMIVIFRIAEDLAAIAHGGGAVRVVVLAHTLTEVALPPGDDAGQVA